MSDGAFQVDSGIAVQDLFVCAGPPTKQRKLAPMSFKHEGALDVCVNFLIRPAALDEVISWVEKGQIVMVTPEKLHHAVASCAGGYC